VVNIPGSVNVVFTIKTTLQINPALGYNNTPILLNSPMDIAAKDRLFIHNPGAYDSDGDSLAYKLVVCLGENGEPISNYQFPESSNRPIFVDSITGDLIWDAPIKLGSYNVAIEISEFRSGVKIGRIIRDMQITVYDSDNYPPEFSILDTICVVAGDTARFQVAAIDSSYNKITLTASGGPFEFESDFAIFESTPSLGYVTGRFTWPTSCSHARLRPYQITIKAIDDDPSVPLVNFTSAFIKVIAPPITGLTAEASNSTIELSWDKVDCSKASGYRIYRRENSSGFAPEYCQTGIPSEFGYQKIYQTKGLDEISFLDNNKGLGLFQGHEYCYRVVLYFEDGSESKVSDEICASPVRGIPIFTKISVLETDVSNGQIAINWLKPSDFDSIAAPGPYKYLLYRSEGIWGENLLLIDSLDGADNTSYLDKQINTFENAYSYSVEFINNQPGNRFLIGSPQVASSSFLKLAPADNSIVFTFEKNVPWIDTAFTVFAYNKSSLVFDSLFTAAEDTFKLKGLSNGIEYCYRVLNHAYYSADFVLDTISNFTQINCASPIDTIPPCAPPLQVISECDSFYNQLTWYMPIHICGEEAVQYNVFYKSDYNGDWQLLQEINNESDTSAVHYPIEKLAACYYVQAVDSFGNKSLPTNVVCVDVCNSVYELPNIFTPNGDGINDFFIPVKNDFVVKVDMKIYNRYGVLVFETDNPDIDWDGKDVNTGRPVTPGVYYYMCDVYEPRLIGIIPRHINGFVHVVKQKEQFKE
jgi:gliding motility-associated-like protein